MHQVQVPMVELNRCTEKRKKQKIKVSRQQVEKWFSKELSYTLDKPVRKKFSRNKTIVFYIDELWQMDLCDTSSLKQFNDGDTFILSIIDVFSKIGFARSLKDKKGPTVLKSFLNVLKESGRKPTKVQTDAGFVENYFCNAMHLACEVSDLPRDASMVARWCPRRHPQVLWSVSVPTVLPNVQIDSYLVDFEITPRTLY